MSAVVTGQSGLLGQCVARALERRGIAAHGLRARFGPTIGSDVVPIELSALTDVLARIAPQFVFHVAGTSNAASVEDFYRVNTLYASVLLDALAKAGLHETLLILVGSAAEYGPMLEADLPAREDGQACPADFYGASKLAQTNLGVVAARKGHRVLIVRPSNMIGPGMPRRLALGSFVHQLGAIARGEKDPVLEVGDLSGCRDLIDVDDAAEFIVRLAETPLAHGQVVNVSSGHAVAMSEVVRILLTLFERCGRGSVNVHRRDIAATAASSRVHFSCNRRLLELLGELKYAALEVSLSRILNAELGFTA